MATLVFAPLLLLAPIVGALLARKLSHRAARFRWGIFAGALVALGVAMLVTKLSFLYTGPRTYPAWSAARFVHGSALFVLTVPGWSYLAIFQVMPGRFRYRTHVAIAAGYISILPTLILLMEVGCNQAGACF